MSLLPDPHLGLFLTRGMSLQKWWDLGMFQREIALYRHLHDRGIRTTIFSWGSNTIEQNLVHNELPGGRACGKSSPLTLGYPKRVRSLLNAAYESLFHRIHRKDIQKVDIIKTNQISSASIAIQCSKHFRKPFIARCGFMWSYFLSQEKGLRSPETRRAIQIENEAFLHASRIIITTDSMKQMIVDRLSIDESKVYVIPNYVNTDIFFPCNIQKTNPQPHLITVGRHHFQKNQKSLIRAVSDLDIQLTLIGKGPMEDELREEAKNAQGNIRFVGNLQSERLPKLLNEADIFVLPSLYEGHPKTLCEAMACGLPCIATDVPGNRDVIQHGKTGWLCESTEPESIRSAIETLLSDDNLRKKLGYNARKFVEDHYSLDIVCEKEMGVYQQAIESYHTTS